LPASKTAIELEATKDSGMCSERDPMNAAAADEYPFRRCSALVRTVWPCMSGPVVHALWRQ